MKTILANQNMMPILRNKLPDIPDLVVCPHSLYKLADFVVMDAPSIEYLPYHFAMNHVAQVYKKGKRIL